MLQGRVPGGGWFPDSSVLRRQAGLGQDESPALLAMAWGPNQLFFAETPEGGKSRDPLPRYPRGCRGSWGMLLQSLQGIFFLGQTKLFFSCLCNGQSLPVPQRCISPGQLH